MRAISRHTGGILTAIEYLFAVAMTIVIVWLAAELGQNSLKR